MVQVVGASDGADEAPLNAVGHARSLARVEQTARDAVATILDVADDTFDIDMEYVLPPVIETVVFEAIGARTWLEAARDLYRDRSTVAIRALTAQGLSQRESATLLGLPEHWADTFSDAT